MKTDARILQDVPRELRWNPPMDEIDVRVEGDSGVVTLTRTVSSYAKRMAAQEETHRVAGVLDVTNDIQVHVSENQERTDTECAQAVRHTLESDVDAPDTEVRSTVSRGWVSLEDEITVRDGGAVDLRGPVQRGPSARRCSERLGTRPKTTSNSSSLHEAPGG